MPFGMGFGELVLILIIVGVVFGSRRLPDISESVQRFLREGQPADPRLLLKRWRWTRLEWAAALLALVLLVATTALLVRGYR